MKNAVIVKSLFLSAVMVLLPLFHKYYTQLYLILVQEYSDVPSNASKLNSVPPISKSALIHIYLTLKSKHVLLECAVNQYPKWPKSLIVINNALDVEPFLEIQMCMFTYLSTLRC